MNRQAQKSVLSVVLLLVSVAGVVALSVRLGGWAEESATATAAVVEEPRRPGARLIGLVDRRVAGPGQPTEDPIAMAGPDRSGPPVRLSQRPPTSTTVALPSPVVRSSPAPAPAPTKASTAPPPSVPAAEAVDPVPTTTTLPDSGQAPEVVEGLDPTDADQAARPIPEHTLSTAPPTIEAPAGPIPVTPLSTVELEIVRLTNELRTDPNGPLHRHGPLIDCDGRIPVDRNAGVYLPVAAVAVDPVASERVSRPWAGQLTTDLGHRPRAGVEALEEAGIAVWVAGENIAYHNYPDTAFRHFAGWRESDGHFCNLMDPEFTHVGIGEVRGADGLSYAAQNFYSLH